MFDVSAGQSDEGEQMRYVITVIRYEQVIVGGTYYGEDRIASVDVTECADRAELLRELEAHGARADERRAEDSFTFRTTRYVREWHAVAEAIDDPALTEEQAHAEGLAICASIPTEGRPAEVTELLVAAELLTDAYEHLALVRRARALLPVAAPEVESPLDVMRRIAAETGRPLVQVEQAERAPRIRRRNRLVVNGQAVHEQ
jgi:hypothetical protein